MPVPLTSWAQKREDEIRIRPDEVHNVPTGDKLRARRQALQATLYEVGAIAGMTARQVSAVERKLDHRVAHRERVSDALGVIEEQQRKP